MASIHEQASKQFYDFELPLRGWSIWDVPVAIEPPFVPFAGYDIPTRAADDGRRPTALSSFVARLSEIAGGRKSDPEAILEQELPTPDLLVREELRELRFVSSAKRPGFSREAFERFLLSLTYACEPITFEMVATADAIDLQFAVADHDVEQVSSQFAADFPEAQLCEGAGALKQMWESSSGEEVFIIQFGLGCETTVPISVTKSDSYGAIFAALSLLREGELAVLQFTFQQTRNDWAESILRTLEVGKQAVFINAPELLSAAKIKIKERLFAVTARLAVKTSGFERTRSLLRAIGSALCAYSAPGTNELIPLENTHYPFQAHEEDFLKRQSRRTGMLLASSELSALVHLPDSTVTAAKLLRNQKQTRAAPASVQNNNGVLLGFNTHAGGASEVRLTEDQRVRNTYLIGTPGTGKSTLLLQLIRQDLVHGHGLAVIDPHGDLVESVLGMIPEARINDVVFLDPSDDRWSIGFNVLSAHSQIEKNLLAADLVSVFERLSTSWGDQMGIVLKKAIMAFLESPRGGTLVDLQRFLIEPDFRKDFLQSVTDPDVVYYWSKAFPLLSGNRSVGPILTRLETLLGSKTLRAMVAQRENRLDVAAVMNEQKIFLAKLSQGLIGKENSYLLGSLLMSRFQQAAMGRQQLPEEKRPYFWIFADEFHDFITPSMAEILSGARKYHVGMTLAHQEVRQLDRVPEVASAVRSAYTRVCFRVTESDAKSLVQGFTSFTTEDLQKLSIGEAICRVERSDHDFNLTVPPLLPQDPLVAAERRARIISAAQEAFAPEQRNSEPPRTNVPPRETADCASAVQKTEAASAEVHLPPPPPHLSRKESNAAEIPEMPSLKGNVAAVSLDLGRGGEQHRGIQKRLKLVGEKLGFRATIEKAILAGSGSIDVALEREDLSYAVEITVTTTVDHEVGNVLKCLKTNFGSVVVLAATNTKLQKMREALVTVLDPVASERVHYFLPDDFILHLERLPRNEPPVPTEAQSKKVRGYTVKRSVSTLGSVEAKAREEEAIKTLARAMKSMKSKPDSA